MQPRHYHPSNGTNETIYHPNALLCINQPNLLHMSSFFLKFFEKLHDMIRNDLQTT